MAKSKKGKKGVFGSTIVTPVGRLIFPCVARPTPYVEGAAKKYSASLICKPSENLEKVVNEVNAVGVAAFGAEFSNRKIYNSPICLGAEVLERIDDPSDNVVQLYTGRTRLIARGNEDKEPPRCYLADKTQMPRRPGNEDDLKNIEQAFYAGAFVRLCVTPFSYHQSDKIQGVGMILRGVQFYKDGPRLGVADIGAAFDEEVSEDEVFEDEVDSAFGDEKDDADIPF